MPVTLITPTSDRPVAFALCEKWMSRQTYDDERQWIVVDDGEIPVQCNLGQEHILREPTSDRVGSFLGNLSAALERVKYDHVCFIEDDDWYHASYLKWATGWLDKGMLAVGESNAKYYNVRHRWYCQRSSRNHASLCQTSIHSQLIPWIQGYLETTESAFIDLPLWRFVKKDGPYYLAPVSRYCIGIKGIPGKSGLGTEHRIVKRVGYIHDDGWKTLLSWIGSEVKDYRGFYRKKKRRA